MLKTDLPLTGIKVLDFSQFLAGPTAALRLADLGAEVIKIERPQVGDLCRNLNLADATVEGDSLLFHVFNRNKKSVAANLKDSTELVAVKNLIVTADVMIHNFRPGVMEKIGLDFAQVEKLNPRIIYASVSGYGETGPWRDKPGQDLLAQAMSGLTWHSGNQDNPPIPMGLPVLDMAAGASMVQGILATLIRRGTTGKGGQVEVDLLSTAIDFQYEPFTVYLNTGENLPKRCAVSNANVFSTAPYGLYATKDGYLALAMTPISKLAKLLEIPHLNKYSEDDSYTKRDEIKQIIADQVAQKNTSDWLDILEKEDIWCADVLDWQRLLNTEGFKALDMVQEVTSPSGVKTRTTCLPIKIDGQRLKSSVAAPLLGAHTEEILNTNSQE